MVWSECLAQKEWQDMSLKSWQESVHIWCQGIGLLTGAQRRWTGESHESLHFRKVTSAAIWRIEWRKADGELNSSPKNLLSVRDQVRNDESWNKGGAVEIRSRWWFWEMGRPYWPMECEVGGECGRRRAKMTPRCLDRPPRGWWCRSPRVEKCEKKFLGEWYKPIFFFFLISIGLFLVYHLFLFFCIFKTFKFYIGV